MGEKNEGIFPFLVNSTKTCLTEGLAFHIPCLYLPDLEVNRTESLRKALKFRRNGACYAPYTPIGVLNFAFNQQNGTVESPVLGKRSDFRVWFLPKFDR